MLRVELRNGHYRRFKVHDLIRADIAERRVGSHPGCAGRGIHCEDALSRVQKIGGIARNLEGGESAAFGMLRNRAEKSFRRIIKEQ